MMATDTSASLRRAAENPASLTAAYRLFDSPAVPHEAVIAPHVAWTREQIAPLSRVLIVQDTAVFLLHMKFAARDHPQRRASTMVDERSIEIMSVIVKRPPSKLTVAEFWHGIGKLGGHFGRNSDGPLGWLRVWEGWCKFQMMLRGAEIQLAISSKKDRDRDVGTSKRWRSGFSCGFAAAPAITPALLRIRPIYSLAG